MTVQLDQPAFEDAVARHRRELHVHCYRMLGSFQDAEDAVQDTFVRGWRRRESLRDIDAVRAWLYRIATTVCLDRLRAAHHTRTLPSQVEPPNTVGPDNTNVDPTRWIQPYPDVFLDELTAEAAASGSPVEDRAVERGHVELAFIVALQRLPWQQRAVLVARDVLGWSAAEAAGLLDTSVSSVNSSLHRARSTLRDHRQVTEGHTRITPSAQEQEVAAAFMSALDRDDADALMGLLTSDARCTMPPYDNWFEGRTAVAQAFEDGSKATSPGDVVHVPLAMNRQPAVLSYRRHPDGGTHTAFAIAVLTVDGERIAEITIFHTPELFALFGHPLVLDEPS